MIGRGTATALALMLGALPAFADHAHSSSSHGSSSGGHASSGSHASHASSTSGHATGGSSATGAQSRHPRAGTGSGYRYGYGRGYGYGYRGRGYGYRSGFPFFGFGFGYSPYYYGYGYSPFYGYDYPYSYGYGGYGGYAGSYSPSNYGYQNDSGAIRTFVEPDKTQVRVDGRYAGVADDFDGMTQRLYVAAGAHEITLSLEGYQTHRIKVYVAPGATLKLHYDMVKGSGDDGTVGTLGNPEDERWGNRERRNDDESSDDRYRDEVRRDDSPQADEDRDDAAPAPRAGRPDRPRAGFSAGSAAGGEVRLAIQPADASVYVDGQFRGPAGQLRSLDLRAGTHRIEIVRPGFRTVERDVDVRDGEDTALNVELSRS